MLYVVLTVFCEFDNFTETLAEQVHEWFVVDVDVCVYLCWSDCFDCYGECNNGGRLLDPDAHICFEMCSMERIYCIETCIE